MLRILTLNMWGVRGPYEERWTEAAEEIARLRPDIVSLQEADDIKLLEKITSRTKLKLALAQNGSKELAILTRLPFTEEKAKKYNILSDLENYVRKFESLQLQTEKGPIYIANTHLSWRSEDEPIRRGQAEELARFADALDSPVILTGDFNSEYGNKCLRPLREAGFKDLLEGKPDASTPSWDNRNPYIQSHSIKFPNRRIDLILGNAALLNNFQVASAKIVCNQPNQAGNHISDHFGVLVELT